MEAFLQDLRYGFRRLLRSPGITSLAVLSLALGIGVNTTVFGYVNQMLLRPLPVEALSQLVRVYGSRSADFLFGAFSYPDYKDLAERNQVFSAVAAERLTELSLGHPGSEPEQIWGGLVTGSYFPLLGVHPALGRALAPDDDRVKGGHPVVVLSYRAWLRRFGGDPGAVGAKVTVNSHPYVVIGVAPEGFVGTTVGMAPEAWIPMMMQGQVMPGLDRLTSRDVRWLSVTGRLKPGFSAERAHAGLEPLARQLAQENPQLDTHLDFHLVSLADDNLPLQARSKAKIVLGLLLGVAGLVLLIACANLTNLLLAGVSMRRSEMALRLAIGIDRARLVRQLLTESVLMALLAGAASLVLAAAAQQAIAAVRLPSSIPADISVQMDYRVLLFTLGVSLLAGLLFGLVPALQTSRVQLLGALKSGAWEPVGRRISLRSALIVGQVSLCMILLTCAGLFLRSLFQSLAANPGFETDRVVLGSLNLGLSGYTQERGKVFYSQLLDRIDALPAVAAASLTDTVPLQPGGDQQLQVVIEGQEPRPGEPPPSIDFCVVAPGFFNTLKIPFRGGRDLSPADGQEPGVAVINQTMAKRFWPNQAALGKRFRLGDSPISVVGVVADTKYGSLGESARPFIYLSALQHYQRAMTLVVRTAGDPAAVVTALKGEVRALDPNLPLADVRTMQGHLRQALLPVRLAAWFFGVFALLALVLASVGIYGVMSYVVRLRTRELGIRMAIGARRGEVLGLVLRQGMILVLAGVALGLGVAFFLGRLLAGMLYEVSGTDARTLAGVSLFLVATALVAAFIPARRASRLAPMEILRHP
jgi:predicted permease